MTEMLDEQTEVRIAPDGTVTVRLTADENTIRDIDFANLMVEFANAETVWRRHADCEARERANAAEEKMAGMFAEWRGDRKGTTKSYARFLLLLLYIRRVRPQA